jgi:group I intron endonuclease
VIHHIYQIINLINDKKYVGYTSKQNPIDRWKQHQINSTNPSMMHRPLYRAIRKYGADNFSFEPLYCSTDAEHTLSVMENHFIEELNTFILESGYNLTKGGESNFGWVPTDETRRLWSMQRKGRKLSEEHKEKISKGGKLRYKNNPEWKEFYRQLAIENNKQPPKPTAESRRKGAITRTGGHIHTDERKAELSILAKEGKLGLNTKQAWEKKKETWKETGRGKGAKNGNAVFAKVYNPKNELVGSGFLREICDQNNFPFNKFLAASRHGNALQRGEWKEWKIIQISHSS